MAYRDLTRKFQEKRYAANRRQMHLVKNGGGFGVSPYLEEMFGGKNANKKHKRRNSDEHASGGRDKLPDAQKLPPWADVVEKANGIYHQLELKMDYLQKIHARRLMVRFDDSETQQDNEINELSNEITILFRQSEATLKKISASPSSNMSAADQKVRINIQRSLATKLQEMSGRFRKTQREYMNFLQVQKGNTDIFGLDESKESSRLLQQSRADGRLFSMSDEDYSIQIREREINRIAKSIIELSAVFKQLATMVIDQGTVVDRIDYNMDMVLTSMESGLKELHRAEKYQSNSRSARCIHLLLVLISICFCILVLKHTP